MMEAPQFLDWNSCLPITEDSVLEGRARGGMWALIIGGRATQQSVFPFFDTQPAPPTIQEGLLKK